MSHLPRTTMKPNDPDCCAEPILERCAADLPDNPHCAPNYHFGMLLGVEDFRAELGFHLGRLRRHQRLLHGSAVVAGYAVEQRVERPEELRVGPGLGIDPLGRDLQLDTEQCVNLCRWWEKHSGDEAFLDIDDPNDATLDLDVIVCHASCLSDPVPAIADPCAGDAADVAYSRICETVKLSLARAPDENDPAGTPAFHLLRMLFSLAPPRTDADGNPLPADQWLIDRRNALHALPPDEQSVERPRFLREVLARAVAEIALQIPEQDAGDSALCLRLARLRDVHFWLDANGWHVDVGDLNLGVRDTLLPTSLLQALLTESTPGPASGPLVVRDGASLTGKQLALVFDQPLAEASVKSAAFAVSEFIEATGWQDFTFPAPSYDDADPARPTVHLTLDRVPAGKLVRATVIGSGSTPLLGASLIPAGAPSPAGDGLNLSTSIREG